MAKSYKKLAKKSGALSYTESGELKLSPIFHDLNKEYDFNTLRLAMLFVDQ